ncbi:cyclase family protein [Umezakia ovalisporum]|uniref:cyclase family protein n=1 Tax=Umezakia ovalisporum TaxID=75695 RepID=UPI0035B7C8B0
MTKNKNTITYSRVIHLSHIIDTDIPQWPGDPTVEFTNVANIPQDGYYLRRFCLGEHSATHINAPNSFHQNKVGIDQYSAQSLVLPGVVIDICKAAAVNADYSLTIGDVLTWEKQHGEIPMGSLVILYTGWQNKWLDKNAFFNTDVKGIMHFCGFSYEATQFLLQQRQIAGLATDTHGVDPGQDNSFSINSLVLAQQGIVLENLTNLHELPARGTTVIIGVLRLRNGSGSPVGILALVP